MRSLKMFPNSHYQLTLEWLFSCVRRYYVSDAQTLINPAHENARCRQAARGRGRVIQILKR